MDIIIETVSYLEHALNVQAQSEAPKTIPPRFVMVRRAGGDGDRFVDRPRLVIHCWDESDEKAGTLAADVATAMLAAPDFIENLAAISQDTIYQNDIDGRHRWTVSLVCVCNR